MPRIEIELSSACVLEKLGEISPSEGYGVYAQFSCDNSAEGEMSIPVTKRAARSLAPLLLEEVRVLLVVESIE